MSARQPGLCLVQKSAPGTVIEAVGGEHYAALCEYFQNAGESLFLTRFLEHVHEAGRWIICDCLGPAIDLTDCPALTVARSQKGKLFLRNLRSRQAHAGHCPFRYEPGPAREKAQPAEQSAPRDLLSGALNLHRAPAAGMATPSAPGKGLRQSRSSSSHYPRLGQVLLHLMTEAGMLAQGPTFDFLEGIKRMRVASEQLQAFAGTPLEQVLCLSARQEDQLLRKVEEKRGRVANAYGLMVVVVHEVEKKPLKLIRRDREGKVEWCCQPEGEIKVWSRRSISKGPFMAAITYAPEPGGQVVKAQHAFVLPILSNYRPLPVESDLERHIATSLLRLIEWAHKGRGAWIDLIKPMHDLLVESGQCRPDFVAQGPGGQVVVEVMGMLDDPRYRERKERTVPLMREIGEVFEVGPLPVDEGDRKALLKTMNRWVLARTGGRRPAVAIAPRYSEV